jgi:hypothetical protein
MNTREIAADITDTLARIDNLPQQYADLLKLLTAAPVEELKATWEALGPREHNLDTSRAAEDATFTKLTTAANRLRRPAYGLWSTLNGRLMVETNPALIASAEFRGGILHWRDLAQERFFALGLLDRLPADHKVHGLLRRDGAYRTEDGQPALVLGLEVVVNGNYIPADVYDLAAAVSRTRSWRAHQLDQERKAAEEERMRVEDQERLRQEAREKMSATAMAMRLEVLEKELAALRAGKEE